MQLFNSPLVLLIYMSETTALVFGCAVFTSGAQHDRTTAALVLLYIITFDLLLRLDYFFSMNGDYCIFFFMPSLPINSCSLHP